MRISEFSSPGWWNPGGIGVLADLNITIVNNGTTDVANLTLEIRRLYVNEDICNITRNLGVLYAGETRLIQETVSGVFNSFADGTPTYSATLKLGEEILDVQIIRLLWGGPSFG